ncbi:putative oxidoreductase [Virgisporangium aliadipatigenens]|uniref:Putative oxidoreductase n=1 Tax=Virgisporangium aliadipatigenens TaxID=741659 RepID=A0A8J3YG26_9ACTN|nr:zinc-binding dehydrogenase [Virgisporangium aliadipatigenens]GIJ44371.1 putative oxidoreductase [Virgisporangium aliadipatigenens]
MSVAIVATKPGAPVAVEAVEVEVPAPGPGEVTVDVRAAGVNQADFLACLGPLANAPLFPAHPLGYEVAGVISAIGPDTAIASGGGAVGDPVLAFRTVGGFAERVTIRADDVYRKPDTIDFPEAANLLLCGTSAAKMLRVTEVAAGDTVLLHAASGGIGVSILQQARMLGARVIGTCGADNVEVVRRFGGEPVEYGDGLEARVRELAPDGVQVALDCAGTDEALDVSFALVRNRRRVMTCAAYPRAFDEDMEFSIGTWPAARERAARADIIALAAAGSLVVPIAGTHPLSAAGDVLNLLSGRHPGGGKHALVP